MKLDLTNMDVEHLEAITLVLARVASTMTRLTRSKMNGKTEFELTEQEVEDFKFIELGITE